MCDVVRVGGCGVVVVGGGSVSGVVSVVGWVCWLVSVLLVVLLGVDFVCAPRIRPRLLQDRPK